MKPQLSKNCSTTKNVFSSSGASQSLSSFICTLDIYNLALFYPNNFVKLSRISIKVMKDLWYFGHLHLKTDEKWTFFTISRPILLSSFTCGDMVNILSFPCRVLQTTKDKSSYFQQELCQLQFPENLVRKISLSLVDDHGILACSSGIYTNNENRRGERERKRDTQGKIKGKQRITKEIGYITKHIHTQGKKERNNV